MSEAFCCSVTSITHTLCFVDLARLLTWQARGSCLLHDPHKGLTPALVIAVRRLTHLLYSDRQ